MGLSFFEEIKTEAVRAVAEKMVIAAITAPKGCGKNHLVVAVADKTTIQQISNKMKEMAQAGKASKTFNRDAENILNADCLVIIGTKINPLGLSFCGLCGFQDCQEKNQHPNHPCAFNTNDLGIAIGSAVSVAMDHRIDNRVMYTVGMAVRELNLLGEDVKIIHGIPLSASPKNPFFDRG